MENKIRSLVEKKDVGSLLKIEQELRDTADSISEIIEDMQDKGLTTYQREKTRTETLRLIRKVRGEIDLLSTTSSK